MLSGVARCHVGAHEPATGAKVAWRTAGPVGLISADEIESGVPLADAFKSPTQPVYVVHGGDHFTVVWHPANPVQARMQARVAELFAPLAAAGAPPNEAAAQAFARASLEVS